MKNKIYTVAIMAFTLILMLTSIDILVFNKSFFHKQYEKLDTAASMQMSNEDLNKATDVLLDYIKGDVDSIDLVVVVDGESVEMFNIREKDHMIDVKALYRFMLDLRLALLVFVALVTLVALGLFDFVNLKQSASNIMNSLKAMGVIFGAIGAYAILDFNSFWTSFHELFFSNDLWLLDPRTDRMINMFPEPFFNAMVMRIMIAFAAIFVGKFVLAKLFSYFSSKIEVQ